MKFKKVYIISLFFSFLFSVNVIFNVDMQEQYITENGIHLAGADTLTASSFGMTLDSLEINSWSPDELTLNDNDYDGIFSISIELENNTVYAYKFLNGIEYELLGELDRLLETGVDDIILDVQCYDKIDESCDIIDNSLIEQMYLSNSKRFIYQKGRYLFNKINYFRWTQAWAYYSLSTYNNFISEKN